MDPTVERQISSAFNESNNGQSNSTLTSRISLPKFCCVVAQFDQIKRELVKETGFGGLLGIKISHKTNLKFSAFLMERLNPDTSKVMLSNDRVIEITDLDVHEVFGLPLGSRLIPTGLAEMSDSCIEFTKLASMYSRKGIHSLKAAESILAMPLDENSPRVQRDCFKIAFVVFSIGHVLNPSAKHDYTSVEYWAALVVPSELNSFNWCRYVRENLLKGARKLSADLSQHCSTIQMLGCHLLLQVAVLDKLSPSSICIPQNITPRINVFDHGTIKKAIQAVTQTVYGGTIFCGVNCHVLGDHQALSYQPTTRVECTTYRRLGKKTDAPPGCVENNPLPHASPKPKQFADAAVFANQMRSKYPHMASEHLGFVLKEHNSRIMANINELRHCTQIAMSTLVDSLVRAVEESCTCCKILGPQNPVLGPKFPKGTSSSGDTLEQSKLATNLAYRGSTEGSSAGCGAHSRKRVYAETEDGTGNDRNRQSMKPRSVEFVQNGTLVSSAAAEPEDTTASAKVPQCVDRLASFIEDIVSSIINGYSGPERLSDDAGFAQCTDQLPPPQDNLISGFTEETPQMFGMANMLSSTGGKIIEIWITKTTPTILSSVWFKHPSPRFISVVGSTVRREIIGLHHLSHECCAIIVRRLGQIDLSYSQKKDGTIWRKVMEPDFTTLVLRGIDPRYVKSIQRELLSGGRIDKCRMFIFPALLEEGWCCYMLDMLLKRIIVLDPLVGPLGFSDERVNLHEFVSNKILVSFFSCVKQFFTSWHCNEHGWTRSLSTVTSQNVESQDHGICALYMAINHNGDKILSETNQEALNDFRLGILYELIRLRDNESNIPADAMESIKNSLSL